VTKQVHQEYREVKIPSELHNYRVSKFKGKFSVDFMFAVRKPRCTKLKMDSSLTLEVVIDYLLSKCVKVQLAHVE